MPSSKTILMAMATALVATSNAHMIMKTPTPFGKSSLNSSPLDATGADFPCKQRTGVYEAEGANNVMPVGSTQTLSFTGSAVHGGGSCQISLTSDKAPSKSSQWQVIHSIIGGCPAKGVTGNLPEDPNGSGAGTYQFTIPQGIAPGEYTLAWTWFNKIGNREMYMNCAPVQVSSGSGKREAPELEVPKAETPGFTKRATFPAMFVANIGNGCTTVDSQDVNFPDPGTSVDHFGSGTPVAPAGTCPVGAGLGSSSGSGASPPVTTLSTVTVPTPSAGVFQPIQSPSPIVVPAPGPTASVVALPVPSSAPSAIPAGGANGSGTAASPPIAPAAPGSQACTTPGVEVCSPDGTMIGMCDINNAAVMMHVATGTKCVGGTMVFARSEAEKKPFRFARGHVRRHHSSW